MNSPTKVAADIAAQLRADPIAASQILEYIPATELLDLLNLRAAMAEDIQEQIDHAVACKNEEIDDLETEIAELRANR
jgi:cytochrome c-type biogenesis protein CcmH/NrfF